MPGIREYVGANDRQHVVHTGGEHASYLQLPIKTARGGLSRTNAARRLPHRVAARCGVASRFGTSGVRMFEPLIRPPAVGDSPTVGLALRPS